jgi:hypothetical protein
MSIAEVVALIAALSDDERRSVFQTLRQQYGIAVHPLEADWNTTAEAILEAIHAAPDLTQRGVRGILAEATFRTTVVPDQLPNWQSEPFEGDMPYDLLLDDGGGALKVQVKNQRKERGQPKVIARLSRSGEPPVYVVETQRTRTGNARGADGQNAPTRPYRFGEFDILAVCLQPSSGNWTDFIYCPAHLLLARKDNPQQLEVLQPIYSDGTGGWTRDFDAAARATREHLKGK